MKTYTSLFLALFICFSCERNEVVRISLAIDKTDLALRVDESANLSIVDDFLDETDNIVIEWVSSDSSIVTVDDGVVTGVSPGVAYIYATGNGLESNTCIVTVTGVLDENNDVYLLGNNGRKLLYWKNGIATQIAEGEKRIKGNAIYVVDNDIYVAGDDYTSSGASVAKYWVNGIESTLATEGSVAKDIVVWQDDVYVVGNQRNTDGVSIATLWKNGSATYLDDGGKFSTANSITISGGDILITGYYSSQEDGNIVEEAKYWVNGDEFIISKKSTARAFDILVNDNDLYVLVNEAVDGIVRPVYYKNGNSFLVSTDTPALGKSIAVVDQKVYVAGYIYDEYIEDAHYTLWVDGVSQQLSDQDIYGESCKIAAGNGDVYVLANEEHPHFGYQSKYYKNGNEVIFASYLAVSHINDIVVIPK